MLAPDEAAKQLAIPVEAIRILIQLGRIRPSIQVGSIDDVLMINEDEVPSEVFDDATIAGQLLRSYGAQAPEFLYLPTYLLRMGDIHTSELIVTNSYQTLEGDDVQLFHRNGSPVIRNHGRAMEVVANAQFSNEEIERYKRTQIHELVVFRNRPDYLPFQLPQKVDPAAEAMVDLGNQFFKDNGSIPIGPASLRKYMTKHANNPWEVVDKYNGDRRTILVEGIPISYESFTKRFKQYLEDNGR